MAPAPRRCFSAFFAYSHLDGEFREQLDRALAVLKRTGRLDVWFDRKILGGQDWNTLIEDRLTTADLVFLLISPDFFASDYCFNKEMTEALTRRKTGRPEVIPIIVRPVSRWRDTELGALQAFPTDGKPVSEWTNRDTAWTDVAEGVARLLDALETQAVPPPKPEPLPAPPGPAAVTQSVRAGLEALQVMMRDPAARAPLAAFRSEFEESREQIALLADYKDIHDQLHDVQKCWYDQIVPQVSKFPKDELGCEMLLNCVYDLSTIAGELREIAGRKTKAAVEAKRIADDLERIKQNLEDSVNAKDTAKFETMIASLRSLLAQRPSKINTRLNDTAASLRLDELVDALADLHRRLAAMNADPDDLGRFKAGVDGLESIRKSLEQLTATHDQWQEVDNDIRLIESDERLLAVTWPMLEPKLEPLWSGNSEAWARTMGDNIRKMHAALGSADPVTLRSNFRWVRRTAVDQFFRVDKMLKGQCDQLRTIGAPLDAVLSMME